MVNGSLIAVLEPKPTIGLPVESDKLDPGTPILLRQKIGRRHARALWIKSNKMRAIVLDEIDHAVVLEHLVCRVFREGEHVLGCIVFLLVDPTTFNANRIHKQ
jgi:hypothetical protein